MDDKESTVECYADDAVVLAYSDNEDQKQNVQRRKIPLAVK